MTVDAFPTPPAPFEHLPAPPDGPVPARGADRSRPAPSAGVWVGQVVRTVWVSLRRNGPLIAASVLATAVALTLIGSALLVRQGVDAATIRWRGGVETIVFLQPGADDHIIDSVGDDLRADSRVREARFVSATEAYDEFKVMFRNSPDLVASVGPDALPASWRVVPRDGVSADEVAEIGQGFEGRSGVYQVVYARDAVESVLRLSNLVTRALDAGAAVLAVVAVVLVFTTVRSAAWARRDELAIMRQIGAPPWLIRAPFLTESALLGAVGGALAGAAVFAIGGWAQHEVAQGDALAILKNFSVPGSTMAAIGAVLIAVGALSAAAASAVAVQRHTVDPSARRSLRDRLRTGASR